mgnify:FL=1
MCCDNCALLCQCDNHVQTMKFERNVSSPHNIPAKTRPVSVVQRQELHQKLLSYRKTLIPESVKEFMPVGHPNVFFEFSQFQIDQVLCNCEHLFTLTDIVEHVEIWRHVHANNVFPAFSERNLW